MMAPPPGSTPMKKPRKDPLSTDAQHLRQSSLVGRSPLKEVLKISLISEASRLMSTSEIPKSPMATTTKSNPSSKRETPKVNRVAPWTGSMPTVPSKSPRVAIASPLIMDSSERYTAIIQPSRTSEKYSGGPNLRAKEASEGATR